MKGDGKKEKQKKDPTWAAAVWLKEENASVGCIHFCC
jgi:hypothetical protein